MPSENFNIELSHMDERLTDMEGKIDAIDKKLQQVVDAILGNPLTKTGGFISDIDIMKKELEELKQFKKDFDDYKRRTVWIFGIVVSILLIIQYLVNIYSASKK